MKTENMPLRRPPLAARAGGIVASASPRAGKIIIPQMFRLKEGLSIMAHEVTVGLFKQVMKDYEISGHNAALLMSTLCERAKHEPVNYVNLYDAREFAVRFSRRTGQEFRLPTDEEFTMAKYMSQMPLGDNLAWTDAYAVRRLFFFGHSGSAPIYTLEPEGRQRNYAIRLVREDKISL